MSGLALLVGVPAVAGPPAALTPTRVAGPGVYVRDLEAERAWYTSRLGLRVLRDYKRADGRIFEYVLGFGAAPDQAVLVLAQSDTRPPGPNRNSRLILAAPDAKALARHLEAAGEKTREAVPGAAYFLSDPEGNSIELYTPPKP